MKKITWLVLSAAMLFAACTKEAIAPETSETRNSSTDPNSANFFKRTRTVQTSDYNQIFSIPCSNDGAGEEVSIVGTSELITETIQLGPVLTTITVFKIKNASGSGAATEKKYVAKGGYVTTQITSSKDSRYNYSYDEKVSVTIDGTSNGLVYKLIASQITGPKGNVIKEYKVQESSECN
jgi:hypothetical protein